MPTKRAAQSLHEFQGKEKQLARLERRLEAQIAQSSLLQSRLTSTLDALDSLKLTHERELSTAKKSTQHAQEKLSRLMEYASAVEQERDECRDALLKVVEKVEENTNLATWPHTRMRLPDFLDPIGQPDASTRPDAGCSDTGAADPHHYAKYIVASLRADLEKERVSHMRTHEQAELEIATLRAQLARREAELEACIAHKDHATLLTSAVHAENMPAQSLHRTAVASGFTVEEVEDILGMRASKNREMELQIKHLSEKLQQARLQSVHAPERRYAHTGDTPPPERGAHFSPKSPDLRPCSPNDILSPFAMTPRNAATPRVARGALHPVRPAHPDRPAESAVKSALTEVQKLEEEVRNLAAGIDDLGAQRRLMWSAVGEAASPVAHRSDEDASSQNTVVPSGSERHSVDHEAVAELRIELDVVRQRAADREAELLAEIQRLQAELTNRLDAPATGSLLDADEEERSMDLGSPLAPTAVLWNAQEEGPAHVGLQVHDLGDEEAPREATDPAAQERLAEQEDENHDDLPLRIPLPPSPVEDCADSPDRLASHPLRDRPPTPFALHDGSDEPSEPVRASGCSCADRVLALEREVEDTKQAVTQRDEEIVELRRLLNELRISALGRWTT